MNELEEILELLGHEPLLLVRDALFELVRDPAPLRQFLSSWTILHTVDS